MEIEGVIKYEAEHESTPLREKDVPRSFETLLGWRSVLWETGLLGAAPGRYGGVGFGNVSVRTGLRSAARGSRAFLVSGTQTSGLSRVSVSDFALVESYDLERGVVRSRGSVLPSSESLTHGAIYDHGPHIQCVLHVHAPSLWSARDALRLPTTPDTVEYGTPAMASALAELLRRGRGSVVAMAGHEDGIVAYGRTVEEAGTALIALLAHARGRGW